MKTKIIEVRDEMTFIALLCTDMNVDDAPSESSDARRDHIALARERSSTQRWFLRRCGYPCDGRPNILITRLDGRGYSSNDPYSWGGRTFPVAHRYIIENWNDLRDGDVVDVQFILKETAAPKVSERLTSKGEF